MSALREKLLALRAEFDMRIDAIIAEDEKPSGVALTGERVYLTAKEYAEHRGCSYITVIRWIKSGMPCERSGTNMIRIVAAKADEWHRSGGADAAICLDAAMNARRA